MRTQMKFGKAIDPFKSSKMEFRVKEKMMSQVYNFQKGNNAKRTILQVREQKHSKFQEGGILKELNV